MNFFTSDVTERIGALEVELNATRTELKTQISLAQDPRLSFFSSAMPGSNGRHSEASRQIKKIYDKCLFCGSKVELSLAHLVAGNSVVNYSVFGKPRYLDDLDVKSPRNFILLCGTKGKNGTCHNEFDNYCIGMIPAPLGGEANQWTLLCLRPDFAKYKELNNKTIVTQEPHPYRRLLAWRNRKCITEHGHLCSDVITNALRSCDLSETANSISNGDSDDHDDSMEPDDMDGNPVKSVR